MKLDCATVEEAISSFARGEAELSGEVRRHIEQCVSCAKALAEAETSLAVLRCLKQYPQSPDCRSRVASRISGSAPVAVRRRFAWAAVPAAVAVLIAVLLLFNYIPNAKQAGTATPPEDLVVRQPADPQAHLPSHVPAHEYRSREEAVKDVELEKRREPESEGTTVAVAMGGRPEYTGGVYTPRGFQPEDGGTSPGHADADVNTVPRGIGHVPAGGSDLSEGSRDGGGQEGEPALGEVEKGRAVTYGGGDPPKGDVYENAQDAMRVGRGHVMVVAQAAPSGESAAVQSQQAAFAAQRKAELERIAVLIHGLSQGRSGLLLKSCASANPPGRPSRSISWGDLPIVSVCPVSDPVRTKLPVGDCIVLGSINLLARAEPPGMRNSRFRGVRARIPQAQGTYLLVYTGQFSDEEQESGTMSLISVSVDDEGEVVFRQAFGAPAERHTRPADVFLGTIYNYGGEDWYGASIRFQVAADDPPGRIEVRLALHEPDGRYRSYRFQLDLDLLFT